MCIKEIFNALVNFTLFTISFVLIVFAFVVVVMTGENAFNMLLVLRVILLILDILFATMIIKKI